MKKDPKQFPAELEKEFHDKAGKATGDQDSVVDGHLDGIKGSSQRAYGGDKPVRPALDEKAKKLDR